MSWDFEFSPEGLFIASEYVSECGARSATRCLRYFLGVAIPTYPFQHGTTCAHDPWNLACCRTASAKGLRSWWDVKAPAGLDARCKPCRSPI